MMHILNFTSCKTGNENMKNWKMLKIYYFVQCLIGLNIDRVLLNADMFFVKKFSK